MKKAMLFMVVFGALCAGAMAGGFSVSFGYRDCGRSYYRPSYHHYHHGYYRSPVVVYSSRSYCHGPYYRSHYPRYRSYGYSYRPSAVYVPRIRYCR